MKVLSFKEIIVRVFLANPCLPGGEGEIQKEGRAILDGGRRWPEDWAMEHWGTEDWVMEDWVMEDWGAKTEAREDWTKDNIETQNWTKSKTFFNLWMLLLLSIWVCLVHLYFATFSLSLRANFLYFILGPSLFSTSAFSTINLWMAMSFFRPLIMFQMLGCENRKMALRELCHPSAQLVVLGALSKASW